jgi:phytoene desaturase
MHLLAIEKGVQFLFNRRVTEIMVEKNLAKSIRTASVTKPKEEDDIIEADVIIGAADYHFIETKLLPLPYRSYTEEYWNSRVMAPSCLIYYVGLNKRLDNVHHHSLFFDVPFDRHAQEIYTTPQWPADPLFYVSVVSITDPGAAPPGCENLFFLVPVAAGLENDTESRRDSYFEQIIRRFEQHIGQPVTDAIIYKRSFANSDFVSEYNAFKGNAYGLANTLLQTAILKPSCRSKKVHNLFYAGQLTVPGPGVPPALISGEVVAREIIKYFA